MLSLFRSSPLSAPGAVGVRLVAWERGQKQLITAQPTVAAEKEEKRKARESPLGDQVSVQVATGSHACPRM